MILDKVLKQMNEIPFQGNIVPHSWYDYIKDSRGKPYLIAIVLLSDIAFWYRPHIIRDETTGRILRLQKKFAADKLQRSYGSLAKQFGLSKFQVRKALRHLESMGIISLTLRNIVLESGLRLSNVLYIGIHPDALMEITRITKITKYG